MRTTSIAACFALLLLALSPLGAQETTEQKPETKTETKLETAAVLPWRYIKGTSGAIKTSKEFLATVLAKAKVDTVSEVKTLAAWEDANKEEFDSEAETLPTPAQLLRTGKQLGVDWVIAGRAKWHSRSIWVGLGPKTKSTCTVDVLIVDVKKEEVALKAEQVKMDSNAKEDTLKAVGTVFVSALFTVVSGGPKTPHEQRAVQLAMAKAMLPWLEKCVQAAKINVNAK